MSKKLIFLIIFTLILVSSAFAKEISYTQEDRDRLIRVEEGLKAVNQRIDGLERSINQRINTSQTLMLWGFGILFGGMGMLMGFVIWDRRTALAPAIKKAKELEERGEMLEKALKELAKKDPNVAEALRHIGFL